MVRERSHHTPLPRRTVLGERSDNVFASPLFPSAEAKSKKRDSFIMRVAQDADEMLLNVQPPSSVAGMTDTESEGEQTPVKSKGKAVIRAGRMATPEASQNITVRHFSYIANNSHPPHLPNPDRPSALDHPPLRPAAI